MVVLHALVVVTDKSVLHDRVVGCMCRIGGGFLHRLLYETVVVTDGDIGDTDVGVLHAAFVLFHFLPSFWGSQSASMAFARHLISVYFAVKCMLSAMTTSK